VLDVVVPGVAEDCAPAAPGDVREPDVIAETRAREEVGDAEGALPGQVGREGRRQVVEVGRVEPEGEGVLLLHEEVGLQGPLHQQERHLEERAAELVDHPVAGGVCRHLLLHPGQLRGVGGLAIGANRVEAQLEEPDEIQGDLGMEVERPDHVLVGVVLRLRVGAGGVAEADDGVDQRRLLDGHQPAEDELVPGRRVDVEDLRCEELAAQPAEALTVLRERLAAAVGDAEGADEPGLAVGLQREGEQAAGAELEGVEDLHDLHEEAARRRIGHREDHRGLRAPL
jgi:hypothetical protein